jgi:3-oxoacyl-[acyl-carrier protein] reductase
MDLRLKGKTALVMGSSGGLGYAIASTLLDEGVTVVLNARSPERLERAARELGTKHWVACDHSRPGAGAQAVRDTINKVGNLDILVTNSGGPPKGSIIDLAAEQWQAGFQSLWLSATDAIREALPGMKDRGFGRILLVTSAAAKEPMAGLTVSNGLRAGLLGLTKSVSNEVAGFGITINAILPGYTRTDHLMEFKIPEETMTAHIPAKRLGEPNELGDLVAFLASERAAYITGQTIAIDGGYLHGI